MTIPPSLVAGALNLVSRIIAGNGGGQGSNGANGDGNQPSFKDAMKMVSMAKLVADKINPADKQKLEQILHDGDLPKALDMLQSLVSKLFPNSAATATQPPVANGCCPPAAANGCTPAATATATAATATAAAAANPPADGSANGPTGLGLNLGDSSRRYGVQGISTNGDPSQLLGGQVLQLSPPGIMDANGNPTGEVVNPTAQVPGKGDVLAAMVGAGKTKPADLTPTVMPTFATAVDPMTVAANLVGGTPPPAAVPTCSVALQPKVDAPDEATPGVPGPGQAKATANAGAIASIQVETGGAAMAGKQSQENFFLINALRREMKGKVDVAAVSDDNRASLRNQPPGLTYEAPKVAAAQLDAMMAPPINTQKVIDQIMDGVFKSPMQLPKVVNLNLNPAHLGPLQVQVSMQDDGLRVHMVTGSAQVKSALEQSANELRTALANAGMALGQMGVDVRQGGAGNGNGQRFAQHANPSSLGARLGRFGRALADNAVEAVGVVTGRAGPSARSMLTAVNAFA